MNSTEKKRRAICRQRAVVRFHSLTASEKLPSFDAIHAAIVKRWPSTCGGIRFREFLRKLYRREQLERSNPDARRTPAWEQIDVPEFDPHEAPVLGCRVRPR